MAQSAFFHRVNLCIASICRRDGVYFAVAMALLVVGGCDSPTSKSDKDISAKLREAQAKIDSSRTQPTMSNADLSAASMDTTDSPPMQIHAKVAFADSELRLAQLLANQVQINDAHIDQLAGEIGVLAGEIQADNLLAAALEEYDPAGKSKKVVDSVTTAQEQVSNGPDGVWIKTDTAMIASLSAVDKQRDAMQAELARLTGEIKTNTDERTKLLDMADKLMQESDHPAPLATDASLNDRLAQGSKSVDLFKQASDAREKAAELTVKIDDDTAKLERTQADLAVQQGQDESLNKTLTALKAKGQAVNDDWAVVQAQIEKLNGESTKILGDNPVNAPKVDAKGDLVTDPTIGSKARAIADLADANIKPRAEAIDHFNKAIQLYGAAAATARTLGVDLGARMAQVDQLKPEQAAWKAEKAATDPNIFLFQQADAELQKANLLARSAAQATMRLNQIAMLKPIVEAAKLRQLPTLDENDKALLSQKNDTGTAASSGSNGGTDSGARGSYNNAAALLEGVYNSTAPQEIRSAAKADEVYLQYSWASLEATAGDVQLAAKHAGTAREEAAAAATAGISLPPLPPEPTMATPGMMSGNPAAGMTFVAPTGDALKLVGTYKGQESDPAQGAAATVLTLNADGTGTMDTTITNGKVPGPPMSLKAKVKWMTQPGDKLSLSFTSGTMNGIPLPPAAMQIQTATVEDGGKRLVPSDGKGALVKE